MGCYKWRGGGGHGGVGGARRRDGIGVAWQVGGHVAGGSEAMAAAGAGAGGGRRRAPSGGQGALWAMDAWD